VVSQSPSFAKTRNIVASLGCKWVGSARWVADPTQNFKADGSCGSASNKIWANGAGTE
jgi:hypothetical protein